MFSREAAAGYDRKVIDSTRMVIVGCGALGQFLALVLALIGFRDVVFVDMDHFEPSNHSRSPFYRDRQSKAKSTAAGAKALCTAWGSINYSYAMTMVQALGDAIFLRDNRTIVLLMVRQADPDCRLEHRILPKECRVLSVGPQDTVGDMLQEVENLVSEAVIQLPANFIRAAPCVSCHKPALLNQPEWAISAKPLCTACGGSYPKQPDLIPEQHGSLSLATAESILSIRLSELGLGPRLHLTVTGRQEQTVVRIGGTTDGLVTEAGI
jgi:hypothetical protein